MVSFTNYLKTIFTDIVTNLPLDGIIGECPIQTEGYSYCASIWQTPDVLLTYKKAESKVILVCREIASG
jgi:hypothetical protein